MKSRALIADAQPAAFRNPAWNQAVHRNTLDGGSQVAASVGPGSHGEIPGPAAAAPGIVNQPGPAHTVDAWEQECCHS
jgi:hypothetical protein